ncbi:MAG: preprotein translocase subunit SecG [Deltaproteobacteria bacterium]|jgi:preprotein translocase subunit SecG|nr:preprotein translocase subunit SecG [Deltaproteobacteria bacterium]
METVLYIVHVLVCLGLLPVILLQSGKGGGVSAVFGGGGAGTVFGSRGASNFLTRLTSIAAVVFMCTSLGLSWYSSRSRSVVGDVAPAPPPASTEQLQQAAPPDQAAAPGTATTAQ